MARCVAAGAAAYISQYQDPGALAHAVDEVGRHGNILTGCLHQALRELAITCHDIGLSATLEQTLVLLETGLSDLEIARRRQLSPRTIEDHKRAFMAASGQPSGRLWAVSRGRPHSSAFRSS